MSRHNTFHFLPEFSVFCFLLILNQIIFATCNDIFKLSHKLLQRQKKAILPKLNCLLADMFVSWCSWDHSSELLLWTVSSNINPQHPTVAPHNTEILAGVNLDNFNERLVRVQLKRDGTRDGKWRGNRRMEWVASTLHTTSEHGVSSITTADAHTSAASSQLKWHPCQLKWIRLFRQRRNLVSTRVPSHFKHS